MTSFNYIYQIMILNNRADDVDYDFYGSDVRYQQIFTNSQPVKIEFKSVAVFPNDINAYALVLFFNLVSVRSDDLRLFHLI